MPRIFRAIGDELNQRFNRKKASSTNELIGFRDNGAVVSRDRRGTLKVEIPNVSEKSETLGSDPLAIYKPSGAKQADAAKAMGNFTGWTYAAVNAGRHENNGAHSSSDYVQALTKLLPVGHPVGLFKCDIALPIEDDRAAVLGSRDCVRPAGNQMIGARRGRSVNWHFRRERLPKGLDLGKPESVESCGRKLASIERSAGWRHREELIV